MSFTEPNVTEENVTTDIEKAVEEKNASSADYSTDTGNDKNNSTIGNKILWCSAILYLILIAIVTVISFTSPKTDTTPSDVLDLVRLGKYKGLEVAIEPVSVSETEIDEQIQLIINENGGVFSAADKPAEEGDRVIVDLIPGDETGTFMEENTQSGVSLDLSEGQVPEEIMKALTGISTGEEVETKVANSEGGSTPYKLTVTQVQKRQDELTDDFVASLNYDNIQTVDDLRQTLSEAIYNYKENALIANTKQNLLTQAINNATFSELPDELYEQYSQNYIAALEQEANSINAQAQDESSMVTVEDILNQRIKQDEFAGTTDEYIKQCADTEIRSNMVIFKLAKVENLKPDEGLIYNLAASDWINHTDEYATLLDYVNAVGISGYELNISTQDVLDMLYNNAIITTATSDIENETANAAESTSE